MLDDVTAATDWVLEQPSVDPERLAIVGNSFGGYLVLAATAAVSRYGATVSITPLVDPATVTIPAELFAEFASMLSGVDGEELEVQWDALPAIHKKRSAHRKTLKGAEVGFQAGYPKSRARRLTVNRMPCRLQTANPHAIDTVDTNVRPKL